MERSTSLEHGRSPGNVPSPLRPRADWHAFATETLKRAEATMRPTVLKGRTYLAALTSTL